MAGMSRWLLGGGFIADHIAGGSGRCLKRCNPTGSSAVVVSLIADSRASGGLERAGSAWARSGRRAGRLERAGSGATAAAAA